jgi:poly(ADP-ribose) glycohydrolase ARH3
MPAKDRFSGCLLGIALGDALGARLEGGPLERLVWRWIGKTRDGRLRWTDDTQMSLDFAESLIANAGLNPDDLAARLARGYRWDRGYGPGASKLLRRISRGADWREVNRSVYPDGSFGNGGAVRASVGALFYNESREELIACTRAAAMVTHAHPLGIEGAVLVALATSAALSVTQPLEILRIAGHGCRQSAFIRRLETAETWLGSKDPPAPREVRSKLGNGIAAEESCVTAVYVGLRHINRPFLELQAFVGDCGGDADSIGGMAGALWGAANGVNGLPESFLEMLEARDRIQRVAEDLHAASVRAAA